MGCARCFINSTMLYLLYELFCAERNGAELALVAE